MSMSGHDGVSHLGDIETALRREVEVIAERFPDADHDEVDRCVRETFDQLLHEAEVETHVLAVTRARCSDLLQERGFRVHVRSDDQD